MSETHEFGTGAITARVAADGAELHSLRLAGAGEMLWQAGPAWPRRAPILFPIVGRLRDDTLRHAGATHRLGQHGFARDTRFRFSERTDTGCTLTIADTDDTRENYPFPFALTVAYAATGRTLAVTIDIRNPGEDTLPASVGAHPAFRWPLAHGLTRGAHRLVFAEPEPAPVHRVEGGLLRTDTEPSPVDGRILPLTPALFTEDAVVFTEPRSRSVRYEADEAGAPAIELAWEGFSTLAIWGKPDPEAEFLCIEPWSGHADPADFAGDFASKPALLHIPSGATVTRRWSVTLHEPDGGGAG